MDYLCPDIDRLVACYTCGMQTLPPYRLCLDAHVGCPPCVKYLPRCACGYRFAAGPHSTFDWLVSAMKLKCKYRTYVGDRGGGDQDVENRWYSIEQLQKHYKTECTKNAFKCPLSGCGHQGRIETIVDHYEEAHGPFEALTPHNPRRPYEVTFKIPSTGHSEVMQKIFNGYFLFVVKPQIRRKSREPEPNLGMQNINPSDPLRYTYQALIDSSQNDITVTVSIRITG